jgi:predicted ester cyclase
VRDAIMTAFRMLNDGDADGFAAQVRRVFAPEAAIELPQGSMTTEAALQSWLAWLTAFPGGRFDTRVFADGPGRLVLDETITGQHGGALPLPDGSSLPPTGLDVRLRSVTLVEHDGSRVTAWRAYYDQAALTAQLTPPGVGATAG